MIKQLTDIQGNAWDVSPSHPHPWRRRASSFPFEWLQTDFYVLEHQGSEHPGPPTGISFVSVL